MRRFFTFFVAPNFLAIYQMMHRLLGQSFPHAFKQLPALLAALGLMIMATACGNGEKPVNPIKRDLVQGVYASGKIFPRNYYRATVTVPGYLQTFHVKVGDSVRVGQPLFSIKNDVTELAVGTARNNLELARSNAGAGSPYLRSLQSDVENAHSKMALDSASYFRYKKLREQNAGTEQALDQARTQYEISRDTYRKARSALQVARDRVRTDLLNAQNAYQAQVSQQKDFTVLSVIDGKVYDIMPKLGELVSPQVPVMELGTPGTYEVELSIDETDLNFVREGQEVVYESEAYPGQYFKGQISKVYPKISTLSKSVKALSTIELPAGVTVYAGATIEANIVYARRSNVLVIPRYLLQKGDTVYLKKSVGKRPVKVKTGIFDVEFIEILEGLSESDQLVRP